MNNYFGSPLSPEELRDQMSAQHRARQNQARNDHAINTANQAATNNHDVSMSGSDSLDDIIRQNTNELHRRRSMPQQAFSNSTIQDENDRRLSMMEYGNPNDAFNDFHYPNINTPTDAMGGGYGNMSGPLAMSGHSGPYSQPNVMAMSNQGDFTTLSPDIMGNMMAFSNLNMGAMTADPGSLGLYSPVVGNQYGTSGLEPVNTEYDMDINVESTPLSAVSTNPALGLGLKGNNDMTGVEQSFGDHDNASTPRARPSLGIDPSLGPFPQTMGLAQTSSGTNNYQSPASGTSRTMSQISVSQASAPAQTPVASTPATSAPTPAAAKQDKTIYSKSGFDMLRALWYVATRENQTIQLGAVDMSCAFVVCDVTQNDCPIIYVSDNFQNLTGYNRHEIAGKNCRFLQSPDGLVEAGSRREFVENDAVFKLKNCIARGEEIQQSLINYRKGGKPFLNLLTMIPIPWDTDDIRFFIGFQIDLVECPDAITGTEGGVRVDYQHNEIGPYIWTPPEAYQREPESGQTLGIDDVSALLKQITPNGVASDWHKQSWDKMLLENADDVIHVLSLKGLFLYLSPSCRKVLEYDSNELLNTTLSSICHPSDIVPVTRELKEAQGDNAVNLVFRIRRKNSGFMWFESHGSLFSEQGKGRKWIILVGRRRPVLGLRRRDLEANGGIGDSEIWTKISTSGMFLFVSSSVRSLLDLQPADLVGTSMQDLMRKESRAEFGRTIEKARKGKIAGCKHEVQNKRGQVLQAYTTFYPPDAAEGHKPAFLLAQTKLNKASSRTVSPTSSAATAKPVGALVPSEDPATGSYVGGAGDCNTDSGSQSMAREAALVVDDNIFDELKTTRCTSWQYELRQMEKVNRLLAEELAQLLSSKKKRKRRKGSNMVRDCANCHTRNTPEWRRGPSGNRDLCNSCGLRWAKQTGRVSPRNSSRGGNGDSQSKKSNSPNHSSPLQRELPKNTPPLDPPSRSSTTSATPCSTATQDASPGGPAVMAMVSPDGGNLGSGAPTGAGKMDTSNGGGGLNNPPQSQPMLEGGSGFRGGGMAMTLIQEEREAGA